MATLDRLERLTDLVLVLLHAPAPLTLDEIAREVPGYPEGHDARRQAFERDKRLLREDGVPVVTEPVEGPEQYGYRIDAGAFYLPDLGLLPDEQAALHLAVSGVQLGDPSGRDALLKLGASGLAEARPVAALVPSEALVPLYDALRVHAQVGFRYRGATRSVAPAGLWFREGRWYLVGWDHDRQAARTFRVDRVEDVPRAGPPGSGTLPDGFEPSEAAPDEPWRVGEGAEDDVLLAVDAIEAPRVVEEVGERAVEERRPDGTVVLRLGVTSSDALRSWVLGLLDHAEVVGPPAARRTMVEWLVALAGEGPPEEGEGSPGEGASGTGTAGPRSGRRPVEVRAPEEREVRAPEARGDRFPPGGEPGNARSRVPRSNAGDRLRRLLAIVGWLARVGRAPIAEVAARFGIPEDEVVRELELAACCGLPPYSPDALLEIIVTEDEVEADLGPELARPRRLTAAEGFALAAAARTIQAVPGADEGGALARALAKLDAALGSNRELVVDLDDPSLLGVVRQATEDRARLEIEYHSASSDETTRRVVDPLRVVSLDGHWYVDAHCHQAGGMRRFRVDRLRSVRVVGRQPDGTTAPAEADDLGPDAFVPGPGSVPVRLALDPAAAWVTDTVPVLDVQPSGDGRQVVTLALGGRAWLERLLLGLGPHARVLDPPELVGVAAAAARRVLRRYGPGTMKDHGKT